MNGFIHQLHTKLHDAHARESAVRHSLVIGGAVVLALGLFEFAGAHMDDKPAPEPTLAGRTYIYNGRCDEPKIAKLARRGATIEGCTF